jgi:hypothetical protein
MTRKIFENLKELGNISYDFDMNERTIKVKAIEEKNEDNYFARLIALRIRRKFRRRRKRRRRRRRR